MEDKFESLKKGWQEAKTEQSSSADSATMIKVVLDYHSNSKRSHLYNSLILLVTAIGLAIFFYFVAPMQEIVSRIGIGLMIGGLLVRIVIEMISHHKASNMDYTSSSKDSTERAMAFYEYRRKIHGPTTMTIIGFYTIGFYLLTPEFSLYLSTLWLWVMDLGYILIAIILFVVIRKGVVQELQELRKIAEIRNALNSET